MRTILALVLVAACGAPPKKVNTADEREAPATCCCKSTPVTSVDDKPVYEMENRMECSTHQGECMPDVQCNGSAKKAPTTGGDGVPPPPALAPVTTSTPIE